MKGLIFDIDGTLWDVTEVVADAWNEVLATRPEWKLQVTAEQLRSLFGKPMLEIGKAIFPEGDIKTIEEYGAKCVARQNQAIKDANHKLYDGAVEVIKELSKKHKIFIVSNCHAGYIDLLFELSGLGDYITDSACPADTGLLKADNLKLIMERNHLDEAWYFGDTFGDFEACKKAKVPFIFCRYGFGNVPEEECEHIVDSFEDIKRLVLADSLYENITANELFRSNLLIIAECEKDRIFCGHDMGHLNEVLRISRLLYEREYNGEPLDKLTADRVLIAASLLHDIGRGIEYETGESHDEAGAKIAERIMDELSFAVEEKELVKSCILGHRGVESSDISGLPQILKKADILSRACYDCKAAGECKWPEDKRNKIRYE